MTGFSYAPGDFDSVPHKRDNRVQHFSESGFLNENDSTSNSFGHIDYLNPGEVIEVKYSLHFTDRSSGYAYFLMRNREDNPPNLADPVFLQEIVHPFNDSGLTGTVLITYEMVDRGDSDFSSFEYEIGTAGGYGPTNYFLTLQAVKVSDEAAPRESGEGFDEPMASSANLKEGIESFDP